MDYTELDQKLRTLTEDETASQIHTPSPDFSLYPTRVIDGKSYSVLESGNDFVFPESAHPNVSLVKHTRFVPVAPHIHSWVEMVYLYSGCCDMQIFNTTYHLRQGQLVILDTDAPHSIGMTGEDDILLNILMHKSYFTASFFDSFSGSNILSQFLINAISEQSRHDNYLLFRSEDSRRLPVYVRELSIEFMEPSANRQGVVDHLIGLIFLELVRLFENGGGMENLRPSRTNIVPILSFIEENFQTCDLKKTAAAFHMNPNYLTTLLKKVTGKSFKELVQQQRFLFAVNYLLNTSMPVESIASQAGYQNTTYFYKKFREAYGMTPGEFRAVHRNSVQQGVAGLRPSTSRQQIQTDKERKKEL